MKNCDCGRRGNPLWNFCEDDLVCPQCGEPITSLKSDYFREEDRCIWVYPREVPGFDGPQFIFPLELAYLDPDRDILNRAPKLVLERCRVTQNYFFDEQLDQLQQSEGKRFFCRLIPKRDNSELPKEGLNLRVTFNGDFLEQPFNLKVCNQPVIFPKLEGTGIEQGEEEDSWNVTLVKKIEMELTLECESAPIIVRNDQNQNAIVLTPMDDIDPNDIEFNQLKMLQKDTVISSADSWSTTLELDTSLFQVGSTWELIIPLEAKFTHLNPLTISLNRIEKGRAAPDPESLVIEEMFEGEVRSNFEKENPENQDHPQHKLVVSKVRVRNTGSDLLELAAPEVDYSRSEISAACQWLFVRWATESADLDSEQPVRDKVTLEPGDKADIYVKIDLSHPDLKVRAGQGDLLADIVIRDLNGQPLSNIDVTITAFCHRKPSQVPLAIDFGNSNSYAAMIKTTPETVLWTEPDDIAIPVHDLRQPERFPTAIFFEDLEDPNNPKYVIGHQAFDLGNANPAGLVTDLKRWIGKQKKRVVKDTHNRRHTYSVEKLIQLYIRKMIEEAENLIRRHSVTQIGVSYPSNFSPKRREEFQQIIADMCSQIEQDSGQEITAFDAAADEANCVAIGFVLQLNLSEENVFPDYQAGATPEFVVASFDLGGGSMDTALLRFRLTAGNLKFPLYESEYLGIGGLENFGGDNATIAVMEILKKRLAKQIYGSEEAARHSENPLPTPMDQEDELNKRLFDDLWAAAEAIKIHQSTHHDDPATEETKKDLENLLTARLERLSRSHFIPEGVSGPEVFQKWLSAEDYLIPMEEIYGHSIECDLTGLGGYTVREKIEKGVDEVLGFASKKGVPVRFVVLGGSGSRLPIVKNTFEQQLKERNMPDCKVVVDPTRTKYRVAYGLCSFIDLDPNGTQRGHSLVRSRDYTSAALGLLLRGRREFVEIVPNCSPVEAPDTWYEFKYEEDDIPLALCLEGHRVNLHRRDSAGYHEHGSFDLSETSEGSELFTALPIPSPLDALGSVHLLGSEFNLELKIHSDHEMADYGPWQFKPKDSGHEPSDDNT